MGEEQGGFCKLCGKPKLAWQDHCGAACSVAWEMGIRTPEEYAKVLAERDDDDEARHHEDE